MLYINTRQDNNVYTAHKTLIRDNTENGGYYVPFRLPTFTDDEISALRSKSFDQVVAEILNLFFSAGLTQWDVSFAVGKNPCAICAMNHRIAVAELWRNTGGSSDYLVDKVYEKLCNNPECADKPTDWAKIAIDLAIIFGVYADTLTAGVVNLKQEFDISIDTDHFSTICAAWYARKMGLPIATIVCTEKDSGTVWDLIRRGTFATAQATPGVLAAVERLLHGALGASAVQEFVQCVEDRRTYTIDEESLPLFNEGLFCSVAGVDRVATVINSVSRSNSYAIDHVAALCYGGLQDYRAKNGEGRLTILLGRYASEN